MFFNKLSQEEIQIIEHKGTEIPFSGKYNDFYEEGIYTCKKCNAPLYKSQDKFSSGCGWPSFDDEIQGAIKRVRDSDGIRVEIICTKCSAHLGHVFQGEGFTDKNTRHCVNSISLNFQKKDKSLAKNSTAYFAAGCFWGVEYYFKSVKGVISVISGYMGGKTTNPDYYSVCSGQTGHLETVKVEFDEKQINYEKLVKFFFEIHDFTQTNGQGADIGSQYLSAIFYKNHEQRQEASKIIARLEKMGYEVATSLYDGSNFYEAEQYHQDYYAKTFKKPYCHTYKKIFK